MIKDGKRRIEELVSSHIQDQIMKEKEMVDGEKKRMLMMVDDSSAAPLLFYKQDETSGEMKTNIK